MQTRMKKFLAIVLCAGFLFAGNTVTALAEEGQGIGPSTDIPAEWQAYWDELEQSQTCISMTPGSDETMMNFAWQSPAAVETGYLELGEQPNLSDAEQFTGYSSLNPLTNIRTFYVTASDLMPNTTYYYRATDSGSQTQIYSFCTRDPKQYSFIVFSDTHIEHDETTGILEAQSSYFWNQALDEAKKTVPDAAFMLNLGDMANEGRVTEYLGLNAPPVLRSLPMATCIGNHDKKSFHYGYYVNNPNQNISLTDSLIGGEYWFCYGDVLYMMLDSTSGSAEARYRLMYDACKANPDAKWRVAVYHHNFNGTPAPLDTESLLLKAMFDPLMEAFDVDVVFNGHTHVYTRTHQMENGIIVQSSKDKLSLLDPRGTTYVGASSVNHVINESWDQDSLMWPQISAYYIENEVLYSVISIKDGSLSIKTRSASRDNAVVDEFTIEMSPDNLPETDLSPVQNPWYDLLTFGGQVYAIISNIGDFIDRWSSVKDNPV